ncbi:hypothetical protein JTE90_009304 [Oedothorax gibbosus]|uniref:Uncharacterized protein n=1 Tax=Oedothorax gibbosus TaxID=931172 RepID=A0AAV6TDS1_9ARAC|nr:hypothetical protein JTE90_009304 [Oedothorax gibbosus]
MRETSEGTELLDGSISLTPLDTRLTIRLTSVSQNRFRTSTRVPLASSCPGIVHHLSASQRVALQTPHFHKWKRGGCLRCAPPADGTGSRMRTDPRRPVLSCRRRLFKTIDSRTCRLLGRVVFKRRVGWG